MFVPRLSSNALGQLWFVDLVRKYSPPREFICAAFMIVILAVLSPLPVQAQDGAPWSQNIRPNEPASVHQFTPLDEVEIPLARPAYHMPTDSNQKVHTLLPGSQGFDNSQVEADYPEAWAPEPLSFGPTEDVESEFESSNGPRDFGDYLAEQADQLTSREGTDSSVKIALLLAALSLAPAIILMTTSYVRVVVVLSLLRQAFGAQQLPPTQVITSLSLFLTLLVMAPVWNEIKTEAIDPYATSSQDIEWKEAWSRGIVPVKKFMLRQIEAAGNADSIATFYKYLPEQSQQPPTTIEEVPINVLLPAFMISELKVAFLLGFQIYLPFLVVDLVVSTVTVSMGMLMLPPTMVSFPLKLILFVMVDGWTLVVGMLLQSFGPYV